MLAAVVKRLRRRQGIPPVGGALVAFGLPGFSAVLGPGLLAGLSDDDPAGTLLVAMRQLGKRESVLGEYRNGRVGDALAIGAITVVGFHHRQRSP